MVVEKRVLNIRNTIFGLDLIFFSVNWGKIKKLSRELPTVDEAIKV